MGCPGLWNRGKTFEEGGVRVLRSSHWDLDLKGRNRLETTRVDIYSSYGVDVVPHNIPDFSPRLFMSWYSRVTYTPGW